MAIVPQRSSSGCAPFGEYRGSSTHGRAWWTWRRGSRSGRRSPTPRAPAGPSRSVPSWSASSRRVPRARKCRRSAQSSSAACMVWRMSCSRCACAASGCTTCRQCCACCSSWCTRSVTHSFRRCCGVPSGNDRPSSWPNATPSAISPRPASSHANAGSEVGGRPTACACVAMPTSEIGPCVRRC